MPAFLDPDFGSSGVFLSRGFRLFETRKDNLRGDLPCRLLRFGGGFRCRFRKIRGGLRAVLSAAAPVLFLLPVRGQDGGGDFGGFFRGLLLRGFFGSGVPGRDLVGEHFPFNGFEGLLGIEGFGFRFQRYDRFGLDRFRLCGLLRLFGLRGQLGPLRHDRRDLVVLFRGEFGFGFLFLSAAEGEFQAEKARRGFLLFFRFLRVEYEGDRWALVLGIGEFGKLFEQAVLLLRGRFFRFCFAHGGGLCEHGEQIVFAVRGSGGLRFGRGFFRFGRVRFYRLVLRLRDGLVGEIEGKEVLFCGFCVRLFIGSPVVGKREIAGEVTGDSAARIGAPGFVFRIWHSFFLQSDAAW